MPKESRRCWAQLFSWPAMDGWKDQTSQPWAVFCRAAGSTTVLRVTARGKFGKVLSEQSGLLVTVACFGIGKGGSSNFALRWWRNELVAVRPGDELAAVQARLLGIQAFPFARQSGSFPSFPSHPALLSSGPALAAFTLLSRLHIAGWFTITPAMHHHHCQTFPCLSPPGSCSCCVCISQGPADASDPAK